MAEEQYTPMRLHSLSRVGLRELEPGDICMEYLGKLCFRRIETCPTRMTLKNLCLNRVAGLRDALNLDKLELRSSMRVLHTCIFLEGVKRGGNTADLTVESMTSRGSGERAFVSFDSRHSLVFRLRHPELRSIFVDLARRWSRPAYRTKFRFHNHGAFRSLSFGMLARRDILRLAKEGPIHDYGGMHCSEFVCAAGALAAGLLHSKNTNLELASSLDALASVKAGYPGWPFLVHPKNVMTTNLYQRFFRDKRNVNLLGFVVNRRQHNTLRRCFFS